MNWKSTAVVSGATLLATWFGWTTTPQRAPVANVSSAPRDVRPVSTPDIQEQARRLEHRVQAQVEFADPTRNPFMFAHRKPAAGKTSVATAAASQPLTVQPVGPLPVALTLAGIASTSANQQTAILDTPQGVVLAKEGDHVGTFTVAHVTDMGVELVDADGTTRTLTLRP